MSTPTPTHTPTPPDPVSHLIQAAQAAERQRIRIALFQAGLLTPAVDRCFSPG